MSRFLSIALILLSAVSAGAADRFTTNPQEIAVATTGRIVKIDAKNKTLRVRNSDGQSLSVRTVSQNFAQMIQGLKQHIGVTLPGGITIALPGRKASVKSVKTEDKPENSDEYTVAVTDRTVFQDGGDTIRFEDFKSGEVISIHGSLRGNTLTASRIAKWF